MKRLRRNSETIFAMSFSRKEVLRRMESYSVKLNEHVLKCIVYADVRSETVPHWTMEIATWLNRINRMECSTKLKSKDYISTLFMCFGNTWADTELNLEEFRESAIETYPDFDITSELVSQVHQTYQKLISVCIDMLTSNHIASINEWCSILKPILNP